MKRLCIAGKGEVACLALNYVANEMQIKSEKLVVVPVKSDAGVPSWQPSLRLLAEKNHIDIASLEDVYDDETLVFVSLEFDQIVRTQRFKSTRLYNIHFSVLPRYRGIGTAVWPILNGDEKSGVTLHCIDDGIDTGDIIAKREFCIRKDWDCRSLYMKFNQEAFLLFKETIRQLLGNEDVHATHQNVEGASYYSRSDVNYDGERNVRLSGTAWQVSSALRAFTFWEYQLPRINGRRVLKSRILDRRSIRKAGQLEHISEYRDVLSTVDYDIELIYCAYDDMYKWAHGMRDFISDEAWDFIDEIDRLDEHGWSASMIAAYNCNIRCLSELLSNGADVNKTNYKGTTVLMFAKDGAANDGNLACVELLLRSGANPMLKDYKGMTVIDYLNVDNRKNAQTVMKAILEKGMHGGSDD